ncbi:hypothetical protein Ptr902_05835 [Pyrenophora tritici-repentis]|uniref:Uncharacterized protein n=1 Tax=Pyrenophora tritici-repentis TaxID=45151 RepID=A0A922NGN1_9PLEO|nr:hypothetical protein Ptr86124_006085 [Pyrenophora tritici-repentis]KAI1677141.1 hypothetical protein KJE20_13230 [Pyrenophora tritici-repentis]KAI2483518.1 hypothetical protein Ptr902_05835 [Pyrenophora tritici-repentis]
MEEFAFLASTQHLSHVNGCAFEGLIVPEVRPDQVTEFSRKSSTHASENRMIEYEKEWAVATVKEPENNQPEGQYYSVW